MSPPYPRRDDRGPTEAGCGPRERVWHAVDPALCVRHTHPRPRCSVSSAYALNSVILSLLRFIMISWLCRLCLCMIHTNVLFTVFRCSLPPIIPGVYLKYIVLYCFYELAYVALVRSSSRRRFLSSTSEPLRYPACCLGSPGALVRAHVLSSCSLRVGTQTVVLTAIMTSRPPSRARIDVIGPTAYY